MYETFEHTADLGLRVAAASLDELFAEAARGLLSVLVDNPQDVQPDIESAFKIEGSEKDYLLFDWLSELLYRFESSGQLFSKFDISLTETGLNAVVWGESAEETRHHLAHEVKAITYHQLKVEQSPDGWTAQVIVDI